MSQIFQNRNVYKVFQKVFSILNAGDFSTPALFKICEHLLEYQGKFPNRFDFDSFFKNLSPELQSVLDEIYLVSSVDTDFKEDNLIKLAYEIKRAALKRQISGLLADRDTAVEKDKLKDLGVQLKEVEKKAASL